MSSSILTRSPAFLSASVVAIRVCGMMDARARRLPVLENAAFRVTSATVRLIPSTAIEPSGTTRSSHDGSSSRTRNHAAASVPVVAASAFHEMMRAVPVTCPITMWPPNRPSARSALSRFTREPCASFRKVVFASVSPTASTENVDRVAAMTVWQTPSTLTESPSASPEATEGHWIPIRMTCESPRIESTVPMASINPVNILPPSRRSAHPPTSSSCAHRGG